MFRKTSATPQCFYGKNPDSMILLHVISRTENQAFEIADSLVQEKLILDAVVIRNATVLERTPEGNGLTSTQQVMLMGKTKSLLFVQIDRILRERYPDDLPVIYAVPIAGMDWEQADQLISNTAKV